MSASKKPIFKSQTAKLKAGSLTYWVGGKKGADAEGHDHLPVVYLHGAGGLYKSAAHEMLAADRRIFMPIIPGHDGDDYLPDIDSMAKLAGLIADFVRKKLGGKCDLWGHSFGGWLACWVAALHPDIVDLLVLENPAGLRVEGKGGIPAETRELFRQMFAHPEKRIPDDRPREMVRANHGRTRHYHRGTPFDHDLAARLKDIVAPALIAYGTDEEMIPIEGIRVLCDAIPRHFLMYVYDSKHCIHVDQPERLSRLMRDFFDRGEAFIVTRAAAE
jgi:pimeloyl-ACP methyl ester carboxylesterase